MSSLNSAVMMLDMSLMAAKAVVKEGKAPLQRRLAWLGAELERLASEAHRLADEAGDDPGSAPDWADYCLCRKVPCTCDPYLTPVLTKEEWGLWEDMKQNGKCRQYSDYLCPICLGNFGDGSQCRHYAEDIDRYFADRSSSA